MENKIDLITSNFEDNELVIVFFLSIDWLNFRYRYTGKDSFINDLQSALGAVGRGFESLPRHFKALFLC